MKKALPTTALSALLVLIACAGSCVGTMAREHALWPRVSATWQAVLKNIEGGLEGTTPTPAVASAIAQVGAAVEANDYRLLRGLQWSPLRILAVRGVRARVDRNEISDGVSTSLLMRIAKFSEALQELVR